MLELQVLIWEIPTINGFPSSSISCTEVSTLDNKSLDHTMNRSVLEMQRFVGSLSLSFLACTKRSEIFARLWTQIGEQLKDDSTSRNLIDGYVEETPWAPHA
jgi:hypothetical protein